MRENPFSLSAQTADIIGVVILLALAIGLLCVMWCDYRRYLRNYSRHRSGFFDFLKREQLYIFLFLTFLFLIGGEMLLYNRM